MLESTSHRMALKPHRLRTICSTQLSPPNSPCLVAAGVDVSRLNAHGISWKAPWAPETTIVVDELVGLDAFRVTEGVLSSERELPKSQANTLRSDSKAVRRRFQTHF